MVTSGKDGETFIVKTVKAERIQYVEDATRTRKFEAPIVGVEEVTTSGNMGSYPNNPRGFGDPADYKGNLTDFRTESRKKVRESYDLEKVPFEDLFIDAATHCKRVAFEINNMYQAAVGLQKEFSAYGKLPEVLDGISTDFRASYSTLLEAAGLFESLYEPLRNGSLSLETPNFKKLQALEMKLENRVGSTTEDSSPKISDFLWEIPRVIVYRYTSEIFYRIRRKNYDVYKAKMGAQGKDTY